jgi:predicted RNA binding protein YcfA (HicA-like mRNA interferase family)
LKPLEVAPRSFGGRRDPNPERLGYRIVRQKGSHVRLRHPPVHPITIRLHNPLKTGTLHGILAEVAHMRAISMESLIELL